MYVEVGASNARRAKGPTNLGSHFLDRDGKGFMLFVLNQYKEPLAVSSETAGESLRCLFACNACDRRARWILSRAVVKRRCALSIRSAADLEPVDPDCAAAAQGGSADGATMRVSWNGEKPEELDFAVLCAN